MLKRITGESFFTRYSFLLPFFLVILIILAVRLKRSKGEFTKINYYLNILMSLLILIDACWLLERNFSKKAGSIEIGSATSYHCDSCTRPDIYFLLFDEYRSSTALKELWNFNNNDLDSFLLKKGFSIQPYSRSNYNFTPFSIASTLNMDYLAIPNSKACTVKDYSACFDNIKNNKTCAFLQSLGYKIINYSIFDLDKNPSPVNEGFLPLKTRLIISQTFLSRMERDLLYHLLVGKFEIPWLTKNMIYTTYENNEKIISATLRESVTPSSVPRFIYSHIEMPHPPFYYNKNGKQANRKILIEESNKLAPSSYLEYIQRTNEVIKQIVNSIIDNTGRPVVIILMGDHGFRSQQPESFHFRNQNAIYVSFKDQKWFYPDISNVNEFRVLFNNLFHTAYPLLKDSTSFLADKH